MGKPVKILGGLVALAIVAVVALVAIFLLRDDDPDLATEAPQIPTAAAGSQAPGGSGGTSPTAAPANSGGSTSTAGAARFVIDPAQSTAKYVVSETLRGLETQAVGTTSAITGEIHLTPTGLVATTPSTFRVDLSTLKSDEGMRDNFIRTNTLQTNVEANRYADFTIKSVTGFPTNYVEGQEVTLTLTGTMKIKNVTKDITWQVKARQQGEFLTATADTDFNMTDFGITPPNVQVARARDAVHVQVVFVAKRA